MRNLCDNNRAIRVSKLKVEGGWSTSNIARYDNAVVYIRDGTNTLCDSIGNRVRKICQGRSGVEDNGDSFISGINDFLLVTKDLERTESDGEG